MGQYGSNQFSAGRGRNNYRRPAFSGWRDGGRGANSGRGRKLAYNPPTNTDVPGLCQGCGFRATESHECREKHESQRYVWPVTRRDIMHECAVI